MTRWLKKCYQRFFKLSFNGFILFKRNLKATDFTENIIIPDEYQILLVDKNSDKSNLKKLSVLWHHTYGSMEADVKINQLLADGNVCSCLLNDGEFVGMVWFGFFASVQRMDFAHLLKTEQSFTILHHIFIKNSCRGWGAQRLLQNWGCKQVIASFGVDKAYAFVGVKNFASIRNFLRTFEAYKVVYHLKIDIPFITFNVYPNKSENEWNDSERF